jgi:hypothetical protein
VTVGVNQATLTIQDSTRMIRDQIIPRAMNIVRVRLLNRHGVWGTAWTGFVDERRMVHDTSAGRFMTLQCSGPDKLWEVTSQSGGDVVALAIASMQNIAGSEVIRYSARAVGYDPANIAFDPVVDSGSGLLGFSSTAMSDPSQQKWSAVVEQVLGNAGLEFFFDENGDGHYRRVAFLGTSQSHVPAIS